MEKIERSFGWHEGALPYLCIDPANWTDVCIRQIFKRGIWFYPVLKLSSFGIIHVAAGNAAIPSGWSIKGIKGSLSNLCLSTDRTGIVLGKIFKGSSWGNTVLWFSPRRIINITTGFTNV